MMSFKKFFILVSACAMLSGGMFTSCNGRQEHFISDAGYRAVVENDFDRKKQIFDNAELFSVFDTDMTLAEREAMQFLYAYMPIGDMADYDGNFYLKNVRSTLAARKEMAWGEVVPEMIFRHFVLPIRVNNENLDESRMFFYGELKERVKGRTMYEAALEVNHWCHEKVTYRPSDARTSSPLASVRTAYGRCGEESTFTVAALRSVGIPARQVYTPRWAHTDDNHAWVEVWVDGKWYFMGACEPEPVLNLGWFNAPASRGMLMHTRAFGNYDGPEEVMEKNGCFTEINVIDHYAPTAKVSVTVKDKDGMVVEGASVEFKLYNYAEFYTVARKTADENGRCSLSAGLGDMLVWASKDGLFGFRKVSFGKDGDVIILLDKKPGEYTETIDMDIVPPVEGNILPETAVTDEMRAENNRRFHEEDSIRGLYESTFYNEEKAKGFAQKIHLDSTPQDIENVTKIMMASRGNWPEIERFLQKSSNPSKAVVLLQGISAKDLRDTPAEVLFEHLGNTPKAVESLCQYIEPQRKPLELAIRLENDYVLNPRISNELLTPYKSFLAENIDSGFIESAQKNPQALVDWVKENIKIRNDLNPQRIPIMPMGTWKARIADAHSRDIFFVAVARSFGIPARIEPIAGKVQYYNRQWIDVDFDAGGQTESPKGRLTASYRKTKLLDNPKYYNHFTVARLHDNGKLQTLSLENDNDIDMGQGDTWKGLLQKPMELDAGNYLMVSGTRMANGKVLARLTFFSVNMGETTETELVMRESDDDVQVIGNIDAEAKYEKADGSGETSILNTTGRGYFIIGILGAKQEPTNHALRDIAQYKEDFDKWGRPMVLLFKDGQGLRAFDGNEFGELPETITYGVDASGGISKMVTEAMKLKNAGNLPIFIIADTFGRVVFVSQGYTIGLGEQMMKVVHKL